MKRILASAAVAAFVLSASMLTTESSAQNRLRRPDIVPIAVKFKEATPCKAGALGLFVYSVTVRNVGQMTYTSQTGVPLVWADDQHNGGWPNGWFGQELSATPTLAPNATATVDVYIPYWTADPQHMTNVPIHPFRTRSLAYWSPGGMNAPGVPHNSGPTFNVPAPKGCPPARR